jgi:hypothetical protein
MLYREAHPARVLARISKQAIHLERYSEYIVYGEPFVTVWQACRYQKLDVQDV